MLIPEFCFSRSCFSSPGILIVDILPADCGLRTSDFLYICRPINIVDMELKYIQQIAGKLNLSIKQINNIHEMNTEGATIPFMSRYRKEATGNLDEVVIGNVIEQIKYFDHRVNRIYFVFLPAKISPATVLVMIIVKTFTQHDNIYRK